MIRILKASILFFGCWYTAMASSFILTIDTAIYVYESDFAKILERTDTHVECIVDFERAKDDDLILKVYGLSGEWGKESNLLPSSKDLISIFDKAAEKYTKESPLTIVLGKQLSLDKAASPDGRSFETWNDALKSISALADTETHISKVGIAMIAKLPLIMGIDTEHCGVGSTHALPYRMVPAQGEVSSDMRATELVCMNVTTQSITLASHEKKTLGRDGLLSWNTVVEYDPVRRAPTSIKEEAIYKSVRGRRDAKSNIYVCKESTRLTQKDSRKMQWDGR